MFKAGNITQKRIIEECARTILDENFYANLEESKPHYSKVHKISCHNDWVIHRYAKKHGLKRVVKHWADNHPEKYLCLGKKDWIDKDLYLPRMNIMSLTLNEDNIVRSRYESQLVENVKTEEAYKTPIIFRISKQAWLNYLERYRQEFIEYVVDETMQYWYTDDHRIIDVLEYIKEFSKSFIEKVYLYTQQTGYVYAKDYCSVEKDVIDVPSMLYVLTKENVNNAFRRNRNQRNGKIPFFSDCKNTDDECESFLSNPHSLLILLIFESMRQGKVEEMKIDDWTFVEKLCEQMSIDKMDIIDKEKMLELEDYVSELLCYESE